MLYACMVVVCFCLSLFYHFLTCGLFQNSTLWELSTKDVIDIAEFYVSTLEKFIDRPEIAVEQPIVAMSEPDSVKVSIF